MPDEMTDDEMIEEYLKAVLDAFKAKALAYHNNGANTAAKIARTTEIKNALREIGRTGHADDNFSIAAGEYGRCTSGVCNGQVCTAKLSFVGANETSGDNALLALAERHRN